MKIYEYITYIGFAGCGNDIELDLIQETEKAYKLKSPEIDQDFWLPKSAFDDTGSLNKYGIRLYIDKIKKEAKK